MKIAYLDCPTGISGDMLLGAFLDAGVPLADLARALEALGIEGYDLRAKPVQKGAIRATQAEVVVQDDATERHLSDILGIVNRSRLPERIKETAMKIFQRIGEVEAGIHGIEVERVHLHELGGLDTIVDVTGAILCLDILGIERLYASPLPLGRGFIKTRHGMIPLPAAATLALLEGIPVTGSPFEAELVTPTGAAILAHLVREFGSVPAMRLLATGYGAGKRDLPAPNAARLLVGEVSEDLLMAAGLRQEQLTCLECNLDDMNPELFSYLFERLFQAGVLDVTLTPMQMKKNRPGTLLSVLCNQDQVGKLLELIFIESSTLGVRRYAVERYSLEREVRLVDTALGPVKVKFARWEGRMARAAPEYEDCRRIAAELGLPLQTVYQVVQKAAQELT